MEKTRANPGRDVDLPRGESNLKTSSPPPSKKTLNAWKRDYLSLLGPLVSPLLRDAQGSFDLSRIAAKTPKELRTFLLTQTEVDGIAFNEEIFASFRKVLAQEKYQVLWHSLLLEEGAQPPETLLQDLTRELIEVSANRFVQSHLHSASGRARLYGVLGNSKIFSKEIRADLVKAIGEVGLAQGVDRSTYRKLTHQISVHNYWNLSVSSEELKEGSGLAQQILTQIDHFQNSPGGQ